MATPEFLNVEIMIQSYPTSFHDSLEAKPSLRVNAGSELELKNSSVQIETFFCGIMTTSPNGQISLCVCTCVCVMEG